MAIQPEYCEVYGEFIQRIMVDCPNRAAAVLAIAEKALEIGRIDPLRRSTGEQRFLQGLFNVKSALKNRICAEWDDLQYIGFVQNAKVSRFRAFTKVSRNMWMHTEGKIVIPFFHCRFARLDLTELPFS
jgi:hypothetical protein